MAHIATSSRKEFHVRLSNLEKTIGDKCCVAWSNKHINKERGINRSKSHYDKNVVGGVFFGVE